MSALPARTSQVQPVYRTCNGRRLFSLDVVPTGRSAGLLLYLPPYAEEMNRCRCHVMATARQLAVAGWRTTVLDHFGTGESDGLTTESDWEIWVADAVACAQDLCRQHNLPLTLWGMRTGALLAAEVASRAHGVSAARLLLWQPVADGKVFLNQYLRLRIASQMVHGGDRETSAMLMQRLAAGEDLEVAGYPLAHRVADGLVKRRLQDFALDGAARIDWLEVASQPGQALPPGSQRVVDALAARGLSVDTGVVEAPQFWQLAGDHPAPALVEATVRTLGAAA